MAGHVRKLENGRYMARFPLGGRGRFRSKTFDRKIDASRWLNTQTARRDRGDWVDPAHAAESFQAVAESWLASRRDVAASTRSRDGAYLRNQILPHLGALRLRDVTPEVLDEWVAILDEVEDRAPATVRKAFNLASQVLDRAVVLRKIPANPAKVKDAVSLPALEPADMRFLTVEEAGELADATDPRYRALVVTGAYTGLRWGELAGLRSKRLDLDAGTVTVAETLYEVGGVLGFKDPKTAAARRTLTLPPYLVGELREYLAANPVVGDGLVFADTQGKPLRRSNFARRVFKPAVRASVGEPCRVHDLRHTQAAWLIANGEHPKTIQTRLGHASISTTLDRYGHLMPGLDEAAAARLTGPRKHPGSTQSTATISELPVGEPQTSGDQGF
jgi:integrase